MQEVREIDCLKTADTLGRMSIRHHFVSLSHALDESYIWICSLSVSWVRGTVPLQFRGDLVLRPEAEDREVVDEVIARGRPVRQDGVIGRFYRALELPLGIEVAIQTVQVALAVQTVTAVRSFGGLRQLDAADIVVVIERGDRQLLEMRVAGALRHPLLAPGVDQRRRLADPLGAVRTELFVVVQHRAVLT